MMPQKKPVQLRLVARSSAPRREAAGTKAAPFLLGREHGPVESEVLLDTRTRSRHIYLSGKPGSGKSTALLNLVRHDFAVGNGCCVLDPHGGLVDAILATLPAGSDRIVVVDAADSSRPVGIDMLAARNEYEQDLAVQFFLDLFGRMYLAEHIGPVLFQAVRNSLLLLMSNGRTLAELPLIFTDIGYLNRQLAGCTDPFVTRYFRKVWRGMSDQTRSESLAYFTSKFSPFYEDRLMRGILGQRGGLDFDSLLAERKVLLVHLARGRIGDFNSKLLGQIILHLIRRSAMRRQPGPDQPFFSVVVDEAHEFGGAELCEMLTAMRKFHVGVVMANQSIEDLKPSLRKTVLGSVGSYVLLRQGLQYQPEVESLIEPRFERRDLIRLPDFTALACTEKEGRSACRRILLSPPPLEHEPRRGELARLLSALRYGKPRHEVERDLLLSAKGEDDAD